MGIQLVIEYVATIAVIAVVFCAVLGVALLGCALAGLAMDHLGVETFVTVLFRLSLMAMVAVLIGPALVGFVVAMHDVLFGGG